MAATRRRGTAAAEARPSASTTSTPRRSSASGSSRCGSSRPRPSRRSPSSTTTRARRARGASSTASHRRPRTRTSCAGSSTRPACRHPEAPTRSRGRVINMRVLAVVHGEEVRSGVFAEPVAAQGHELEEWSIARRPAPSRPLDAYAAVIVFGGSMHADEEDTHPWLLDEAELLRRFLDARKPVLGVCLGAQLLAKAAGAAVRRMPEPEIGWHPVELTPAAAHDPLFARLPRRFEALQWHYYAFDLPPRATELARNRVCSQAFRLGDLAWAVQFHPEVTLAMVEGWLEEPEEVEFDRESLRRETHARIGERNAPGRDLC